MELITPDLGLLFWMTLAFGIVFFILAKFAFPVINNMLKQREEEINTALEKAERTHQEMEKLQADNELLLAQAREERDKILDEARQIHDKFIETAKMKANEEKERINQLYGNDFADITPDDAMLIGRWEAWKATQEAEQQAKIEAIKAETDLKLEQCRAQFDASMENLNELHNAAMRRLEALNNGK